MKPAKKDKIDISFVEVESKEQEKKDSYINTVEAERIIDYYVSFIQDNPDKF